MADEKTNWDAQKANAEKALDFWINFLGVVDKDGNPISDKCKKCLLCIIRLISYVESKHGTAGANQPGRDPMQSGNPRDEWYRAIMGADPEKKKKERIVRGGEKKSFWIEELPEELEKEDSTPDGVVPLPKTGHDFKGFTPAMSYFWGILLLLRRLNKKTYKIEDCSWSKLVEAGVKYNGGGDPDYKDKLDDAASKIDCDGCDKK